MSLPDPDEVVAVALAYSTINMDPTNNGNGNVLKAEDVVIGSWNFDTRTFSTGSAPADAVEAVYVTTRRSNANDNPLATSFLRIVNLWGIPGDVWDINTAAIAVKYIPICLRGGFIAANKVDVTSGNVFYNNICVHGQNIYEDSGQDWGVDMNNGNEYEPGVEVSSPYYEDLNDTHDNEGLEAAMVEGDVMPSDALSNRIQKFFDGMTDTNADYMPDYINTETVEVDLTGKVIPIPITETYSGTGEQSYEPGNIYYATCNSSKSLALPTDTTIKEVVIISECPIKASTGLVLEDVVLASTSVGNGGKDPLAPLVNHNAIDLASAAQIGAADFCTNGGKGGVELYALASAHVAAKLGINGLRAVVGGDFSVAGQADIEGVSVQAGHDIIFTAAGSVSPNFGLCENGTLPPGQYAWHYRLVY
jgi:hypothetical protein